MKILRNLSIGAVTLVAAVATAMPAAHAVGSAPDQFPGNAPVAGQKAGEADGFMCRWFHLCDN